MLKIKVKYKGVESENVHLAFDLVLRVVMSKSENLTEHNHNACLQINRSYVKFIISLHM